jgi:hypothetical protein
MRQKNETKVLKNFFMICLVINFFGDKILVIKFWYDVLKIIFILVLTLAGDG